MSIFTIFSRAASYGNLTPGERAFLRFASVVLWGALLSGAQTVAPLLTTMDPTTIAWASVLHTFLAAVAVALALGVRKYLGALGDPPLPSSAPTPAPTSTPASAPVAAPVAAPALALPAVPSAPPASTLAVASPAAPDVAAQAG